MAWIDRFRGAKFRGVSFYVPAHSFSGGRRIAVHEFPKQDAPYVEDMGRRVRRFRVDGYVLGENYDIDRNELIEALEKKGSGKLIHPYYGTLTVSVSRFEQSETQNEMRMSRFTIEFVESELVAFPEEIPNTTEVVSEKRGSALSATQSAFLLAYEVAGIPYAQSRSVINTIDSAFNTIDSLKIITASNAAFRRDIQNIKGKGSELLYNSEELIENIVDAVTFGTGFGGGETVENAIEQFEEMERLFAFSPESSIGPSLEVSSAVRRSALISAGGLLAIIDFGSRSKALEMRDIVLSALDIELENVDNDDLYRSLLDLRSAIVLDIQIRENNLPILREITPLITVNSLRLTYSLYGSLSREQEIIERNHIENPAFIPGGSPIEVVVENE